MRKWMKGTLHIGRCALSTFPTDQHGLYSRGDLIRIGYMIGNVIFVTKNFIIWFRIH